MNHHSLVTFKLRIAYRGSEYKGWQKQATDAANTPTIQELLEQAFAKVLQTKEFSLHGSGRTDSGVHARAQVAHFRISAERLRFPLERLQKAVNAHLPEDIRLITIEKAPKDFHAQYSAKNKTYRYYILNPLQPDSHTNWPFLRPYTWFVSYSLDVKKMQKALSQLKGKHDFSSFQNTGSNVKDSVREISQAKILVHKKKSKEDFSWLPPTEAKMQLLEIRIRGSGFLKQMVRTIAGTLVEIGRGKMSIDEMEELLHKRNRSAHKGITAPAHGLFLDEVEYKN